MPNRPDARRHSGKFPYQSSISPAQSIIFIFIGRVLVNSMRLFGIINTILLDCYITLHIIKHFSAIHYGRIMDFLLIK